MPPPTPLLPSLLLAAPCLLAAPARAQDPSVAHLTGYSLEQLLDLEVVSASRYQQPQSEAPASVTVIRAADIRDYGHRTLADVLRSVRGFYISSDRLYAYAGVRGFSPPGDYNTRLLVLVDGYRLNDNIYDSGALGGEFPLDVDLIERIEIVRGPSSSLYGSNAFFGVVNVVTRSGAQLQGAEAAAALARHGGREGRLTYGRRLDSGLELLVSASGMKSDGADTFYAEFDDPATNNGIAEGGDDEGRRQFYARLAFGGWQLALLDGRREKGLPTGAFATVFNSRDTRVVDGTTVADLSRYHAFAGSTEATLRLSAGRYRYSGDYRYEEALNKDVSRGDWWGAEAKAHSRLGRHRLAYGVEYQRNTRQDQENHDEGAPAPFLDDRRTSQRWGAYLQDDLALAPDWTLSLGLRHDHSSVAGGTTNPRLGLIVGSGEGSVWKLLYGSAYRTPNVYERFYAFPDQQAANPDLEPERIESWEAIWERYVATGLRLTASVYHYAIEDWIVQQTDPETGLAQFRNQPEVTASGAELGMERQWPGGARLRASYSAQFAEERLGPALNQAPRHLVKANLALPLADAWRAGAEYQFTSARATTSARTGGFALANLTLIRSLGGGGREVALSVYNLFDKRYADPAVDPGLPERERILQDGRAWRLKLVLPF